VILVVQSYETGQPERDGEIARCIEGNSRIFDRVIALDGNSTRWTFGELASICRNQASPGDVCVVANSDILFDETIELAEGVLDRCDLISLTRWESPSGPRMIGHVIDDLLFSGSQDSWIFRAGGLPEVELSIPLGDVGCDQVIAGWAVSQGLRVSDPALSIRTWHHHADRSRADRPILGGRYGYPELTTTHLTGRVFCHDWTGGGYENAEVCRSN
jgi:hypothetical protein